MINITKSAVVTVKNRNEADSIAEILFNREIESGYNSDGFLNAAIYYSVNVEEFANVN
jgi:hypothetical protein